MEGEGVGVAARALQFAGVAQQECRLPNEIEAEVGQGQVDLQRRGLAAPFGQTLAQDQGVIAQPQGVGEARLGHQMCLMLSGIE